MLSVLLQNRWVKAALFSLMVLFVLFIPARLLIGSSIMFHELGHKHAGEEHHLSPIYSPSLKTFFGINIEPAPGDETKFTNEDWEKIVDGGTDMQKDILLAGINSDIQFAQILVVTAMILVFLAGILFYASARKESWQLKYAGFAVLVLIFITLIWFLWGMNSLHLNITEPTADLSKLLNLTRQNAPSP